MGKVAGYVEIISMDWSKRDVTPLSQQWGYVSFALSHRCDAIGWNPDKTTRSEMYLCTFQTCPYSSLLCRFYTRYSGSGGIRSNGVIHNLKWIYAMGLWTTYETEWCNEFTSPHFEIRGCYQSTKNSTSLSMTWDFCDELGHRCNI